MIRILLVVFWAIVIFIFTCSVRMEDVFESFTFHFQWNPTPNLGELILFLPEDVGADFVVRKFGHGICFFILTILLSKTVQSKLIILLTSFGYASATEILQLFFNRDGRIFDIGFDTGGIVIAIMVLTFPKNDISLTRGKSDLKNKL